MAIQTGESDTDPSASITPALILLVSKRCTLIPNDRNTVASIRTVSDTVSSSPYRTRAAASRLDRLFHRHFGLLNTVVLVAIFLFTTGQAPRIEDVQLVSMIAIDPATFVGSVPLNGSVHHRFCCVNRSAGVAVSEEELGSLARETSGLRLRPP